MTRRMGLNVRTDDDSTGTSWLNQSYAYDGDELMRSTTTASYSSIVAISSYSWSNHNMVSIAAGATISSLKYYTNQPSKSAIISALFTLYRDMIYSERITF